MNQLPRKSQQEEGISKQRKCGIIHTPARMPQDGKRPLPSEQKVPPFNVFNAFFCKTLVLDRPYYHKLYDKPPSKSVLDANLCETMKTAELKNMSFFVICG